MEMKTAAELKLGDVVELFDGPYGTATVKQIKDNEVTFFRPYAQAENWSYTGGVLCLVGIEEFSRPITDHLKREYNAQYKVWKRGNVK